MEKLHSKPLIGIVGDPGAGKTRLAATAPFPYFLDTEGGAASAVPAERIKRFNTDASILPDLKTELTRLKGLKYDPKERVIDIDFPVGCVVIDTLDAVQQVYKYTVLKPMNWGGNAMAMWGRLLDDLVPIIYLIKSLPVPVIVVTHSHSVEPLYKGDNLRRAGWKGLAFQGQLEDQIMRWFDYVLHLMVIEEGERICYTQPTTVQDYKITAKDRHGLYRSLGKLFFPIKADKDGYPETKAITTIFDSHVW